MEKKPDNKAIDLHREYCRGLLDRREFLKRLAVIAGGVAAANVVAHSRGKPERESYLPHVNILCVMDMGNGAAWVSRTEEKQSMVSMPVPE